MNNIYLKLKRCLKAIREKTDFIPEAGLILGSGLGDYASGKEVIFELPYSEIEGFPVSTVAGHEGRFIFAEISGVYCADFAEDGKDFVCIFMTDDFRKAAVIAEGKPKFIAGKQQLLIFPEPTFGDCSRVCITDEGEGGSAYFFHFSTP